MAADDYLFPAEKLERIRLEGYHDLRIASGFQRVQREDYTGPTPKDDASLLNLVFVLPTSDGTFSVVDQNDKATRKTLNKIRNGRHVYMEVEPKVVKVYGRHLDHLSAAVQDLQSLVTVNSRAPGRKMYPLIHGHPSPKTPDPSIFLRPTQDLGYISFPNAWRGVAMPQDAGHSELVQLNDDARAPLQSPNLVKAIEALGQSVRPVPGQLKMRIHFGILNATAKRKGVDQYSTTAKFAEFLDTVADRGTLHVHHRLGGPDLTLRIREQIYATETTLGATMQKFTPDSATVINLRDVKPKYCLVLFAGSRRIELDVQYDFDPSLPNLRPTAAAPRIYESVSKISAAEIVVACPDHKFDWHLVVEGDIAADEYGTREVDDLNALARSIQFSKPAEDSFEFPAFHIPPASLNTAKIDRVACRVTWAFEYTQKPLLVEVSVYHDWEGAVQPPKGPGRDSLVFDTARKPEPAKSCGINMYGREWDTKMQAIDPVSGHFDQDFLGLFSDNGSSESVQGLLQEIEYLLDMLSQKARQG